MMNNMAIATRAKLGKRCLRSFNVGVPTLRIARALKLPLLEVNTLLREQGIKRVARTHGDAFSKSVEKFIPYIRRARRKGLSLRVIGRRFGLSASKVGQIVGRVRAYKTRDCEMGRRNVIDDSYFDAFADLYKFGLSCRQIGVVFDVPIHKVVHLFGRNGLQMRRRGRFTNEQVDKIRVLRQLNGTSFAKLGKRFGVSGCAISKIVYGQHYKQREDYP